MGQYSWFYLYRCLITSEGELLQLFDQLKNAYLHNQNVRGCFACNYSNILLNNTRVF